MYYPLSQITTNLYTNGDEYALISSNKPYTGYYWRTSQGKSYSGKTPQDLPNEELIPFTPENGPSKNEIINSYYNKDESSNVRYLNLTNPPPPSLIPYYSPNIPTSKDYQIGEYRRYFCKKTNEIVYLEINLDIYEKLLNQDPKILFHLYQPFNLSWVLIGNKEQVYKINKNTTELTSVKQNLPMLSKYLKEDYTKYYK